MVGVRSFYFTCPSVRDARLLCRPAAIRGRYVAQPCLLCGNLHIIDLQSHAVVETRDSEQTSVMAKAAS